MRGQQLSFKRSLNSQKEAVFFLSGASLKPFLLPGLIQQPGLSCRTNTPFRWLQWCCSQKQSQCPVLTQVQVVKVALPSCRHRLEEHKHVFPMGACQRCPQGQAGSHGHQSEPKASHGSAVLVWDAVRRSPLYPRTTSPLSPEWGGQGMGKPAASLGFPGGVKKAFGDGTSPASLWVSWDALAALYVRTQV